MWKEWWNNTEIFSIDSQTVKMKKICCVVCGKYKKFKSPKLSHVFGKKLVFSIVCSRCGSKDEEIFKEESVEILKILDLIININEYQNTYDWRKYRPRI